MPKVAGHSSMPKVEALPEYGVVGKGDEIKIVSAGASSSSTSDPDLKLVIQPFSEDPVDLTVNGKLAVLIDHFNGN
jgi:hypothetical protein